MARVDFPKSHSISKAIDKTLGAEREIVGKQNGTGLTKMNADQGAQQRLTTEWNKYSDTPATDQAKTWNGYGTALKPSHEPVTWAQKPLTCVPNDVLIEVSNLIGALLCLSLSSAKHVKQLLMSSLREQGGACVSVRLLAAMSHGNDNGELSEKTDMFKSPETAETILSIVESWRHILAELCSPQNTFTTSTATALTTELKTLKFSTLPIIRDYTTEVGLSALGKPLLASTAEQNLSDSERRCKLETSATDVATLLMVKSFASGAAERFTLAAEVANTVLQSVTTKVDENITPAHEPICVAMKPLDGTFAANAIEHGVAGINVDGCRVGTEMIKTNGWKTGEDQIFKALCSEKFEGETTQGRWPANIIHDGSEEVVGLFPETGISSGGNIGNKNNNVFGKFSDDYARPGDPGYGDSGSAARFFYTAKAAASEREIRPAEDFPLWGESYDAEKNGHPTVKPLALMEYLIKLVTMPQRNLILDPFCGSGSTLVACKRLGIPAIGIELDVEHCEIAANRLRQTNGNDKPKTESVAEQRDLFQTSK